MRIWFRPIRRYVYLRPKTTDLGCIKQVFLNNEYGFVSRPEPKIIVDAGANIGMATLYFHNRYPSARIFAIEPDPSNFELLSKNCDGLPNVTCIKAALWPTATPLSIVDPDAERWSLSVQPAVHGSEHKSVDPITIPGLLARFQIDQIDLLKLDIEGAERELFLSGAEEWLGQVGMICVEFHDRFKDGCARAFYTALKDSEFSQEVCGENIVVQILRQKHPTAVSTVAEGGSCVRDNFGAA